MSMNEKETVDTRKNDARTELVFILDRSGSMHGLEADTIGGFNRVIEENRKLPGECLVTTVLFDSELQRLHTRLPIAQVPAMTEQDYRPGGMTALLDAVGSTISELYWAEPAPAYVQCVIITDGMENASREYSLEKVRGMITKTKAEKGWDFIFLGANIDAVSTAGRMGISADRAVTAMGDAEGVGLQYEAVSRANREFRSAPQACRSTDWKSNVEADMHRRGGRKNR